MVIKNCIYENNLQFFNHPEGYVTPNGSSFTYVYQYKDHLGNVRLSYADADGNGEISASAEIIEENNYYPFGLKHKGYNFVTNPGGNSVAQRWKFGGKELQDEIVGGGSLEWYDITARNYDPALGRWMNLDPLAEQMRRHSPYNYAFDNPVYYFDPDGMMPWPGSGLFRSSIRFGQTARKYLKGMAKGLGQMVDGLVQDYSPQGKAKRRLNKSKAKKDTRSLSVQVAAAITDPIVDIAKEGVDAIKSGDPEKIGSFNSKVAVGVLAMKKVPKVPKARGAITKKTIKKALNKSTMRTIQSEVSLPVVQRYVTKIDVGDVAPSIKVDKGVVVDGNHRFVAGEITGVRPVAVPSVVPPSMRPLVKPVSELKINPIDFGNR